MKKLLLFTSIVIVGLCLLLGCSGAGKAGGTIVGKVNNTFRGGGVEGAVVTLTSDVTELTATTDSSGNFTFSGLSSGIYTIMVTKDGFFDNKVETKVEGGKETNIDIGMIVAFGGT
ncbi:MAG: carboxypeptidase regulatory-like domain-containing protein [Candidatus Aerophobus sp.]|nr:MAG: carboxypeptidase regulatory-like domain-containing protein [Candidatus Aerophobus sp.]